MKSCLLLRRWCGGRVRIAHRGGSYLGDGLEERAFGPVCWQAGGGVAGLDDRFLQQLLHAGSVADGLQVFRRVFGFPLQDAGDHCRSHLVVDVAWLVVCPVSCYQDVEVEYVGESGVFERFLELSA